MKIKKLKAIPMICFLLFNVLFIAKLAISMPLYEVTRLETPVGVGSFARGINELGKVVGSINGIAVLWEDGQMNALPGSDAIATDINNSGQIVGSSNSRAVLWESGDIIDLGATGPGWQLASAISETGKVSGWSHDSDTGESYAFTWDSETGYQQLDANGKKAYAYDINDNGIVVGRIWDDWPQDPVIWQDGNLQQIGNNGQAQGINNRNQVVGAIYDGISANFWKAFLWEDGTITNLGTIGTANSEAQAINDRGQVVGSLQYQDYEHAMFWQDGIMYDLNDLVIPEPNFILERAFDISNKGQIVGIGTIDGERYAFLLTPIPEIVNVDIIPKTCPNECPIKGGGFIEVAILGTADFDVNDIDIATITLEEVAPTRNSLKDKSSPVISPLDVCDCTSEGRDGFIDLCLKFDKKAIFDALGGVSVGQVGIELMLEGFLNDGTPIEGYDCIDIVKKAGKGKED